MEHGIIIQLKLEIPIEKSSKTFAENIIKEKVIIFYNANHGIVLNYLPQTLSEEQYYELDILTLFMDDITYMEVKKENDPKDYVLKENIGETYSKEVIQSYFELNPTPSR